MSLLTKTEARALAEAFTSFAVEIAKLRYDQWEELTPARRQELVDLEYDLMEQGGQMRALAGVLALDEADGAAEELTRTVADAEKFLKKVATLKKGLTLIASVLSLGAALVARDPKAIVNELKALKKTVS